MTTIKAVDSTPKFPSAGLAILRMGTGDWSVDAALANRRSRGPACLRKP